MVAVLALAGVLAGVQPAKASVWSDFYDKYLKPFIVLPQNAVKPVAPAPELYAPTVEYENAVIKTVEKASPAVVSIVVSKDLPVLEECPYDPFSGFDSRFLGRGFSFTIPCPSSGKTEKRTIGGGTGFVVSEDGLLVTNNHVVADTKAEYTVLLNNGDKYVATIVARDSSRDLALMRIAATGLTALPLGDSDTIRLGQTAITIGNALAEFENTVSVGVVSGLARNVTAENGQGQIETIDNVIQTDAAINPGNSGGPLLNLKGEVIGINTAVVSDAQSIGFAIPVNKAKNVISSFRQTGRIIVPYLGVRYVMTDAGAKITGDKESAVVKGSPADKAGLKEGDIILSIDGANLSKTRTLSSVVEARKVGDVLVLKVRRREGDLTIEATLVEKPE